MAEEVKKAPKPVDPNSAKYKLGKIAADAFADAIEAGGNMVRVGTAIFGARNYSQ